MSKLQFTIVEEIHKGWSEDKKNYAVRPDGTEVLYRVSNPETFNQKKQEFELMQQIAELNIPMCLPLEFGTCEDGVYSLQSWIIGEAAEDIIPSLSEKEQYQYGLDAGIILKKIHSLPAPIGMELWKTRFNRKIDRKIHGYSECGIKFDGSDNMIEYINHNRYLLNERPQCFQHGDYHIGNMMIADGKLVIIDFNRYDFGDPWEEFNRIPWCAQLSPYFASGMVDGYFDKNVPEEFWKLLALYISSNSLSSIYWAIPFGESEIDTMLHQAADILDWYNGMTRYIPSWYRNLA